MMTTVMPRISHLHPSFLVALGILAVTGHLPGVVTATTAPSRRKAMEPTRGRLLTLATLPTWGPTSRQQPTHSSSTWATGMETSNTRNRRRVFEPRLISCKVKNFTEC